MKRLLTLQGETEAIWQKPDPDYLGPGANNTLLATQLGAPVWTDTVSIPNLSVSAVFGSTDEATFNNVDFEGPITIASIAPVANQYIGTDTMNQLGWQNFPSTSSGVISAKITVGYNFNYDTIYYMGFPTTDLNTMAGIMTLGGIYDSLFTVLVSGLYEFFFVFNLTTDGAFNVYLNKNGGLGNLHQMSKAENQRNMTFHYIAQLSASDQIEWEIHKNSVNTALSGRSYMSIKKI